MNIFKMYTIFFTGILLFSLSACSNNSDTPASTTANTNDPSIITSTDSNGTIVNSAEVVSTVILSVSSANVSTHNEIVPIKVTIIDGNNNPFTSGNVKIVYPNDVRVGRDIGSFSESTVEVVNGIANFTYTSPSNLDTNTSDIIFRFYHDSNPSQSVLYTLGISPAQNQIVLTNYTLNTSITTNVDMGLESLKLVSFNLRDDQGELVVDSDISFIKITSLNPSLGILKDTNGTVGSVITINGKNNITVNVQSNTKSGLIPLKVETTFTDVNNQEQNLSEVFNIVVLSGPPSAMSISYVSTSQISERAKYLEKYALTVTDKYNNLINTSPAVSMGAMVGYAKDSSALEKNLYYTSSGEMNATLNTFKASNNVFGKVDQVHDYLVTFGSGYTYDASGKWDINTNTDTSILDLVDGFDGNDTSNLGFAVGHNQRRDACEIGVEWVANVYPKDNNYIIASTGTIIINVEYDYYLTAKSIILWVNINGLQNSDTVIGRIGESRKVTLRGIGLTSEIVEFSEGFSGVTSLAIHLDGTGEFLKNSRFDYDIKVVSDEAVWIESGSSVSQGITNCNARNGISYVDINFTEATKNAGSVTLTNLRLLSEF